MSSKYNKNNFSNFFTIMLVTFHYHYYLLKDIINFMCAIYIYIYIYIYIIQLIGHLRSSSFQIHFFLTLGPNVNILFYCEKNKMEGSTYLHMIQLELHILLTINWWKKWIDFAKNKFHFGWKYWTTLHTTTLNWISIKFQFN